MERVTDMDAILGLSAVSFVTSLITAAVGIGGGLGLLAVMPSFVPISAVVPLHGVTQLASNASRFVTDHRHAEIRLLPAYFGGACLGSVVGYCLLGRIPDTYLSAALGTFLLLATWTGLVKWLGRPLTNFFSLGLIQTLLSLFVASVGLLSQPVLLKQGLSKNKVIVTHAMQMTVLHGLKVATFVAAGFPFLRHWKLLLAMIAASSVGSYLGGFCRNRISDRPGVFLLRASITFFAAKMIADALTSS
jgi:uncharacterized membrane protein YfcA